MDREGIYSWVRDRLSELREGTLSEADRLRLKELAMRDPFIHDAIEGYDLSAHHDHAPHLEYLSHRIQEKNLARRKKLLPTRRTLIMQAVAASLALILVTWAVIYYLNYKPVAIQVADQTQVTDTHEQSEPPAMNQSPVENQTLSENLSVDGSDEPAGLRENARSKAKEYLEEEKPVTQEPPTIADAEISTQSGSGTLRTKQNDAATYEDAPEMKDAGYYANQMDPAMMEWRFTGKIVDPDGQPVTGAFIALKHSNLMTTSNEAGRFELYLPAQTSTVEVLTTGYQDTLITLSQGRQDVVVQLSEYKPSPARSSAKEQALALQSDAASGEQMELALQTYLQLNSRYPLAGSFSNTIKFVKLEFTVNKNFRPSQIKVLRTNTDEAHQKEAIRLIDSGPDWQCTKKPPCVQQYTLYFQ